MGTAVSRRSGDGDDDGFLGRWSRRKRDAARPVETSEAEPEPLAPAEDEAMADPDLIASLPALDEISADTDLAPFVRRGVPQALRNAALRKVWAADPAIRDHVDVAVDYAWDWNAPGGVPGGGGALTPDGVAKMVRDLIGKTQTADGHGVPDDHLGDENGGGNGTESPTSKTGSEPSEAPNPDSSNPVRPVVEAEPKTDAPVSETRQSALSAPRRRHGGAIPG